MKNTPTNCALTLAYDYPEAAFKMAIQCPHPSGSVGTWIFKGDQKEPEALSPCFAGVSELVEWMDENFVSAGLGAVKSAILG